MQSAWSERVTSTCVTTTFPTSRFGPEPRVTPELWVCTTNSLHDFLSIQHEDRSTPDGQVQCVKLSTLEHTVTLGNAILKVWDWISRLPPIEP